MKKILSMLAYLGMSIPAIAQMHGNLVFTGKSSLGVKGMDDSWIEIAQDTLIFKMNGMDNGDITLPTMVYTPMGMTMKGFTIQGAKFTMAEDRTVTFQTGHEFTCTVDDNGTQKTISGVLNSASYSHVAGNVFSVDVTFKYGRMPIPATYIASLTYDRVATGIKDVKAIEQGELTYDLQGRLTSTKDKKGIVIRNGKKFVK